MQPNIYQQAINDFTILGRSIPKLYDLILRGTCVDQNDLIEDWSDLDMSIIVKALDQGNVPEIKKFIRYLKSSNNFKISITVVTLDDFNGLYHYHGMKPLYYSYDVRKDNVPLRDSSIKLSDYFKENLLLYDCFTNLAYLIHDLRSGYFSCGDSVKEIAVFTRHLIKRSKFIVKNAFFVMEQEIGQEVLIPKFTTYFPLITDQFLNSIQNTKYHWQDISKDQKKLEYIMSHTFEQANYIYETTLGKFNEKERRGAK